MRQLHPHPSDTVDLAEAYAYPSAAKPWLRANMVASVDGAATVEGSSRGLSSQADLRVLKLLRGLSDVIIMGATTVRRESYSAAPAKDEWQPLRRAAGQAPAPAFAVVSRSLDLDPGAALFNRAHPEARTLVFTAAAAPEERRWALDEVADVVIAGEREVDPGRVVDELAARGHRRLHSEGGPHLLAQLAAAGKLDELCLTVSPLLAGPGAGRVLAGQAMPEPVDMDLAHILEENGHLFFRYVRVE